mmetsp:Transcript_25143/g.51938  ORF Transcript_25143/g.51938 Transcript_25143/m.51938 type:complete len:433 (+) Transcript_25143:137-1435(+)
MKRRPCSLLSLSTRILASSIIFIFGNTVYLGWRHHADTESQTGSVARQLQNFRGISKEIAVKQSSILENATLLDRDHSASAESFSACLLVNDENPRLPEWLAYHYHTLPLRSIIVAVDPNSRSSPKDILSRWTTMGMEVEIWDQDVYLPADLLRSHGICDSNVEKGCKWKHRHRQSYFVMKCMEEFKERNKSWVLLTDVDEYITFNHIHQDDPVGELIIPMNIDANDAAEARRRLPHFGEDVTILDVIKNEVDTKYGRQAFKRPCLSIPRLLYGSRESKYDANWIAMAPEGFQDEDFVTLRYRWHAMKGNPNEKVWGKVILDLSRIPAEDLKGSAKSIHRPLQRQCLADPTSYTVSLFRVNHYLDSFEAFSYRNDARSLMRKCEECYEEKGKGADWAWDDDVRKWLKSFVEKIGLDVSQELLANAGSFVDLS